MTLENFRRPQSVAEEQESLITYPDGLEYWYAA